MNKNVNHPQHYNSHPNGVECIDVIRHYVCDIANAIKYLWRAGLKPEMGQSDAAKEVEDLEKALWYIEDYRVTIPQLQRRHFKPHIRMKRIVAEVTGWSVDKIACGTRDSNVNAALQGLLAIGIIRRREVCISDLWESIIKDATKAIRRRILDVERQRMEKNAKEILAMMEGRMVDGMHTVTPACRRETEPSRYDPLNMIIAFGTAYCLTDEPRRKNNGAYFSPCDICDLHDFCLAAKPICKLHQARGQEYYREVGTVGYCPAFGTIEIIDERKEAELEFKRQEDESKETIWTQDSKETRR